MIQITGIHRNLVLDKFKTTDQIGSAGSYREKDHDYTNKFHCAPADVSEDMVTLSTYFEINDAILIRAKAIINELDVTVTIV